MPTVTENAPVGTEVVTIERARATRSRPYLNCFGAGAGNVHIGRPGEGVPAWAKWGETTCFHVEWAARLMPVSASLSKPVASAPHRVDSPPRAPVGPCPRSPDRHADVMLKATSLLLRANSACRHDGAEIAVANCWACGPA